MLNEKEREMLMMRAEAAREKAYAPYSGFKVGAALLASSGRVYTGCNVENASLGGTVCAERAAVCAAVGAGEYAFAAIAVAGEGDVRPCGICRQVLSEFSKDGSLEVLYKDRGAVASRTLVQLLPEAFTLIRDHGKP